uniref:Glycosyltransferase 2-like domain-containing protein n=1 Tax=viral metagenome TaxID=1070528 RepID=A0A6C0BTV6_9ZZZZ
MNNLSPVKLPIYVSITSIYKNQNPLYETLKSILIQTIPPDKIFIYLSEEPYILDDGFIDKKITDNNLLNLINNTPNIELNWVKNIGSYRKLLPLLKDKWKEDCIIITFDDDTIYNNNLIKNLINDYNNNKCVIGYSGFTPTFREFKDFNYLKRGLTHNVSLYNFLTGKGGILYKPDFFHKTENLIFNEEIFLNTCDKQDDVWFYLIRILNNIKCYLSQKDWLSKNIITRGLYDNYNSKNNNNTIAFKNTILKLSELGYKFI